LSESERWGYNYKGAIYRFWKSRDTICVSFQYLHNVVRASPNVLSNLPDPTQKRLIFGNKSNLTLPNLPGPIQKGFDYLEISQI
jgi:hypothetical protein